MGGNYTPLAAAARAQTSQPISGELMGLLSTRKIRKRAGEEFTIPVADSVARYIVLSLNPVKLIHVPLGEAYHFRHATKLTSEEIRREIERDKAWQRDFDELQKARKQD